MALVATLMLSGGAEAGCTPSVLSSDVELTCLGTDSLNSNSTGIANTAVGTASAYSNTTGSGNVSLGAASLYSNLAGNYNVAIGSGALQTNNADKNTATGTDALATNSTGARNTASGYNALSNNTSGSDNTALGFEAGKNWITGNFNIAIANSGVLGEERTIRIGQQAIQKRTFIAGIRGTNMSRGQVVVVNAQGQLGVRMSSRRYKQDIQPMGDASDTLLKLRPVTFRYKQAEQDGSRPLQYGLIAEEVAETMPELAIYNTAGQPESVAYQELPSLLLNEYQKQAKELDDTKAELSDAKAELHSAKARLEDLETEIAAMKVMMQNLAAAQIGKTQLASAP